MSDANGRRILSFIRTKMDARTRQPWVEINRAASPFGGIAKSLHDLTKILERFHIAMNSTDLVALMNMFPANNFINEQGLAGFECREFANALYPPETLELGPMGAGHAVLPFMGRHNPFIQGGSGAAAPAGVTGKFEAAHAGTAIAKPITIESHPQSHPQSQAHSQSNGAVEAAPAAPHAGVSTSAPVEPDTQRDRKEPAAAAAAAHHITGKNRISKPQQSAAAAAAPAASAAVNELIGTSGGSGAAAAPVSVKRNTGRQSLNGSVRASTAASNNRQSWVSGLKLDGVANSGPHRHTSSFAAHGSTETVKGASKRGGQSGQSGQSGGASSSAEQLYALTGRSQTNTSFGSTNSQRAKAALAVTFNRRHHERRHEFTQKRPLTASSKRASAYPIEELLGHGSYQHTVKPRFNMKLPGVVPDPNFHKTIAGSLHKGTSWSHKPK